MVYAIVCYGEDKRAEVMNLLNDLRNLNEKVFLLTNIELHLSHFQFHNVVEVKTNLKEWNDFERFKIIKYAFENSDDDFVYYLDCDSRFFDFRDEKFDSQEFNRLLNTFDFDIISSSFLNYVEDELKPPDLNENKDIRNNKFGYKKVIDYLKSKSDNYEKIIKERIVLESVLIFKKSKKIITFIDELLKFSEILISEDENNERKHKAPGCGFAMVYFSKIYNVKIIISDIVCHFFKANFLKEVFPFNIKIDKNESIFKKENMKIEKKSFDDLEIHTLICHKDLYLAVNNFKSLQKFEEFENIPLYFHDDGTLTESDKVSLSKIKNVNYIDRDWADDEIKKYISKYPNSMNYRLGDNKIFLWHKLKTFDYFFFSKTKNILCLDTDLLFIRKPENIIRLLKNKTPFYFPDVQSSYCFNEPKDEVKTLNKVNTGLMYMPSEYYYNLDDIEYALSNLIRNNVNYFPSWIEQSAYAHMFYKNGNYVSLDGDKYRIPYFQNVDIENVECLHFVSYPLVRELYPKYIEYLNYDSKNIIYKKDFFVKYSDIKIPLNIEIAKSDNDLFFKYYWGLEETNQKYLSHEFNIKIGNKNYNFKKESEKTGFFMFNIESQNNFELYHSYEWYGKYDWKLLDTVAIY